MTAYIIKSAIYLSILYVPYMLLLRKESFFTFNRAVLNIIMLLSLVLPLVNIPSMAVEGNPIHSLMQPIIEVGTPYVAGVENQETTTEDNINVWQIVYYILLVGMVVTALIKFFQLVVLHFQIRRGTLFTDRKDGVQVYVHAENVAPYSWFHSIVISQQDYENNADEILKHEMGHIHRHHSMDIVLLNILQIVQWANPLAWVLGSSLRDVHEYEADDAVLRSGIRAQQYQTLLIRKAIIGSSYTFANAFNHSLLTKRITMMMRKKSNPWMRVKGIYAVLMATVALSAFATPELSNKVDALVKEPVKTVEPAATTVPVTTVQAQKTKNSAEQKPVQTSKKETNEQAITVVQVGEFAPDSTANKVFSVVETMPKYPNGNAEMMNYLAKNMKYPVSATTAGVQGRVIVNFIVEKDGSIAEAKVVTIIPKTIEFTNEEDKARLEKALQEMGGSTEEAKAKLVAKAIEDLKAEAVRVVSCMPKWNPGVQEGKPVRVKYNVPLKFRLM